MTAVILDLLSPFWPSAAVPGAFATVLAPMALLKGWASK